MSRSPLVSVIVPAFNAEETITETLESAAAQSWGNLEIVIVDDGSDDGTADRASDFCKQDARARLIGQANAGVAAARNRGIAEARGEWIAPLDADDLWHPLKIEWQLAAAGRNSAGLVYSWSRIIDRRGCVVGTAPAAEIDGDVLAEHLAFNFVGNGSTALISRDVLGELRFDSRVDGCADYLLQLQLAGRTVFAHVPAFLTAYRVTSRSMSSDALGMIRDHVSLYEILMPDIGPAHRGEARKALARWRARLALVLLKRGKPVEASATMAAALLGAPGSAFRESLERIRTISHQPGRKFDSGPSFFELNPEQRLA